MIYIALIAVLGILLLQLTDAIPLSSVGGPMVIGFAFIVAALAVGIHDAWTNKRGVVGWIVNIVVSFVGAMVGAQVGGFVAVVVLMPFMDGATSMAKAGGPVMALALALGMLATILGAWGAVWLVNRWRDAPARKADEQAPPG